MESPQTGAIWKGGVHRLAASEPRRRGAPAFIGWSEAAGCTGRVAGDRQYLRRQPGHVPSAADIPLGL
jgi:beta-ureidopropionase / N-carbamoyl-L-amino-acid hydrolase